MNYISDLIHEFRITRAHKRLLRCAPAERGFYWSAMQELIKARSPEQVHRMEKQRGLFPRNCINGGYRSAGRWPFAAKKNRAVIGIRSPSARLNLT